MNSNRGQYAYVPLNNTKHKRQKEQRPLPVDPSPDAPAPVPRMKRYGWLTVLIAPVLPILFLLALIIPSNILRIAFLGLTAATLGLMWLLRAFARGARGTVTIIYGALAVVIGLALFMEIQQPEINSAMNQAGEPGSVFTGGATVQPDQAANGLPETTPEPDEQQETAVVSAASQRMQDFFFSWAKNNIPEMLEVCAPSWIAQQESPKEALWNKIQQQVPVEYTIEQIDGSDANTSRTITVRVKFLRQSDQTTRLYRLQVIMLRVNDQWYIDPQSLDGTPIDEAQEDMNQETPMPASTKAPPTATPDPADMGIILYYNKSNGKYYHASPTCPSVDQQYWPLTGTFYYSELNSNMYKHLKRCDKCDAPPRP